MCFELLGAKYYVLRDSCYVIRVPVISALSGATDHVITGHVVTSSSFNHLLPT
jgi:hypothetical protein